jgi:tripartite-type tricarboxylate transporter receptor subunit TctC
MRSNLLHSILALCLAVPGAAFAQAYPQKPVRMIVTFAAGGGADFVARTVAPKLGESLGQPVVVENRPGANGAVGADHVAKAAPDGYTLLLGAAGTIVVAPHLGAKLPFDAARDFAPVSLVAISPFVVTLHPSVQAGSVRELIALAKANPGKINYGTSGTGGSPQLATELFKSMTGTNLVHVPYKGLAPALTDLIGGQIQVVFADVGLVKGHIAAGKLKGIAVTSAARTSAMPELPTVAESGVPGYAGGTWYGIFAPAGTPAEIVARVNAETRAALAKDDVKAAFLKQGIEAAGTTPEQFAGFMREENAKWAKVIKEAGITAQ